MTDSEALRPKSILLDAALLASVLVGANLIFARDDPGWTDLNPSPFLLLPVLLGGRYGFTCGLLAGLGTSIIVAALQSSGGGTFLHAFTGHPFLHASLVFLGGIGGELYGWLRRERAAAVAQLEKMQTTVRRLDADVRYLRGVKDELDRAVAARDGEVSTLDAELRRLYASGRNELPGAILGFLKRQVRLVDAALYATDGRSPLVRLACIGRGDHLPAQLDRDATPLVRLALDRGSLVTLPELLQQKEPPAGERYVLAAPLRDAEHRTLAVLVVAGLPFITFTPQTANLIGMICSWAGEVLDLALGATAGRYRIVAGREGQRMFTHAHFRHLLALSFEANRAHRLPSSVVIFTLRGASGSLQGKFEQTILSSMRAGDYAAELDQAEPHVAVLLPLVGERGASIFVDRARQFVRNSGPWPGELEVRRIEIGLAAELDELVAEVDGDRAARPAGALR